MSKKSRYSGNAFLNWNINRTLHELDERLWEAPSVSHFCARTKITGASSRYAVSNGREPGLCQAAARCNLAEAPCNMISFLKLFSEQLQMGSRLIFARLGSRQRRCRSWEPVRLPCCVLWSWTWSFECTLNIQRWLRSLICCLCACPDWAAALARQCWSVCPLLQLWKHCLTVLQTAVKH